MEQATFGAGCFWCVEAVFQDLIGVESVVSGYSGGHVKNPDYKEVVNGNTGHVEVTRITFDPEKISFEELLEILWFTHDPTTLNRQGNDSGEQYRSVIFYHNDEQREQATQSKLEAQQYFSSPIVTAIEPLKNYYEAENYHQNYFKHNPNQAYCTYVIQPKVQQFREKFKDKLKSSQS